MHSPLSATFPQGSCWCRACFASRSTTPTCRKKLVTLFAPLDNAAVTGDAVHTYHPFPGNSFKARDTKPYIWPE
jgi:hypothetical protein